MVIIGLLAIYVGPRFFEQVAKSEVKAANDQMNALEKALETYRLDTGHCPSAEQGPRALEERPGNEPKRAGPYLKRAVPLGPWGVPTCMSRVAIRAGIMICLHSAKTAGLVVRVRTST